MTSDPAEFGRRLAALGDLLHPVLVPVPQFAAQRTREQVAVQRAASRAALARCAKIVGAPIDGWQQNPDRVPLPNEGFHWSVTHKREWTAAVISSVDTSSPSRVDSTSSRVQRISFIISPCITGLSIRNRSILPKILPTRSSASRSTRS